MNAIHKFKSGDVFNQRYTLERIIGVGGFADVWKAVDNFTGITVALKIYTNLDEDGIKNLAQEYARMSNLIHTNILRAEYFDSWGTLPYLVMKYCSGGSLDKKIGQMNSADIRAVISDMSDGLAYLHSQGIVHQDIKPANILIDEAGAAPVYLLSDFGISTKSKTQLSHSVNLKKGNMSMTVVYAPPEKFSAKRVERMPDRKGDIFSFGVSLYELISGGLPFDNIPTGQQMYHYPNLDIDFDVIPDARLRYIIRRCMSNSKEDRPSATELKTLLFSALPDVEKDNVQAADVYPMGEHAAAVLEPQSPQEPMPPEMPQPPVFEEPLLEQVPEPKQPVSQPEQADSKATVNSGNWNIPIPEADEAQSSAEPEIPAEPEQRIAADASRATVKSKSKDKKAKKSDSQGVKDNAVEIPPVPPTSPTSGDNDVNDKPSFDSSKATVVMSDDGKKGNKKSVLWIIIAAVVAVVLVVGGFFIFRPDKGGGEEVMTAYTPIIDTFDVAGVKLEMVRIPGGEFNFGSPDSDTISDDCEHPMRAKSLAPFSISKYEVTQKLWTKVMGTNPSTVKGDDLPVNNVSWEDCQLFIQKLNASSKHVFRLPSEAEWEYAAKVKLDSNGKPVSEYSMYPGGDKVAAIGWFKENSDGKIHAVGGKEANFFGLHDMGGNVIEWCEEIYSDYTTGAPLLGADERVLRGGYFDSKDLSLRSNTRGSAPQSMKLPAFGFRLCLR